MKIPFVPIAEEKVSEFHHKLLIHKINDSVASMSKDSPCSNWIQMN